MKRIFMTLPGLALCGFLFFGCQKSSSNNSDQATLYALLGQPNYSCAKITASTTSAQSLTFGPGGVSPSSSIAYVKITATSGQKLIFASTTTNISSNFLVASYLGCTTASLSPAPYTVTTSTSTNYTITFNQTFTGIVSAIATNSTPTDITVQEQ